MENIMIPGENDIKQWIKEAIREYFAEFPLVSQIENKAAVPMTRKEIADFLKISLVTLHDWMNKGLPYHKQQGKVYFFLDEVIGYIKQSA